MWNGSRQVADLAHVQAAGALGGEEINSRPSGSRPAATIRATVPIEKRVSPPPTSFPLLDEHDAELAVAGEARLGEGAVTRLEHVQRQLRGGNSTLPSGNMETRASASHGGTVPPEGLSIGGRPQRGGVAWRYLIGVVALELRRNRLELDRRLEEAADAAEQPREVPPLTGSSSGIRSRRRTAHASEAGSRRMNVSWRFASIRLRMLRVVDGAAAGRR